MNNKNRSIRDIGFYVIIAAVMLGLLMFLRSGMTGRNSATYGEIRQLLEQPRPDGSLYRPEDFAILFSSYRSRAPLYESALRKLGIPCSGAERDGFFDSIEISVLLSLLRVIDNRRQDIPRISVLRSPLYFFSADAENAERGLCFIIRWRSDICAGMWVVWNGEKQMITKVGEYDFKRRYMKLTTESVKGVN